MPIGGIKFLPNLRFLLDPANPDTYRTEVIQELSTMADVYINCAFGCSHRVTKSIKMLPQIMRKEDKVVVAGVLLYEEIKRLGQFGRRIISNPKKTAVIAGGAKVSDKINILKQFVETQIKLIFIGGKMVNAFLLAKKQRNKIGTLNIEDIPTKLLSKDEENNKNLLDEIQKAEEILALAEKNKVDILFPEDYKVTPDYKDVSFTIKLEPDFDKELQLDLGPKTIESFKKRILEKNIENVFWNGPLGAYDHPTCDSYAEGSLELAKLLFCTALKNEDFLVVIGGGDSAAILNKVTIVEHKRLIQNEIQKLMSSTINRNLLSIDFPECDSYMLWNYFTSNFFVSTGGGASLEFLEHFLEGKAKSDLASYLPGTAALMELCSI
ncbi:MAG: phosphoglycerate kinase [Nitrospinae bacterium CG11_big_fil_rev_8_21_14_0_20_56_8]|nr:MAG: phosphoglycerate kinase [Nitrospinae bacterium CG11_big_fil_rev_8_21_14_0_20_56_8]